MAKSTSKITLERTLSFVIRGEIVTGKLFVGDLEWAEDKQHWICHWSISHIHPEIGRLYGKDPLDAFVKTLDFLSSLIRGSELDGLQVWWFEKGDHAGLTFPLCESQTWKEPPSSAATSK